jgi:hypothetical protein
LWGETGSIKQKNNFYHQPDKKTNLNRSAATILVGVTKSAATFCERFSTMDEHLMRLKQQLYGRDADEKTLEWLDKQPGDIHEVCIPGKYYQEAENCHLWQTFCSSMRFCQLWQKFSQLHAILPFMAKFSQLHANLPFVAKNFAARCEFAICGKTFAARCKIAVSGKIFAARCKFAISGKIFVSRWNS